MRELQSQQEIMASWKGEPGRAAVSICCTAYNHGAYIYNALEGFLIQKTDFAFEVLIYDDASTDETREIIKQYQKLYPEIIKPIYAKENQYSLGKRVNAEFNFSRARGDYIALCEGDDFWVDANKLQIQKDFLDKNPEYVICYTDSRPFDESGILDIDYGGAKWDLSSLDLQRATPIFTLTAFFRNVLGPMPREFCNVRYGDLAIWSLLGAHGRGKFLSSIEPSMYRVHSGGLDSMQPTKRRLQMRLETLMGLYSYYLRRSNSELSDYFLLETVSVALALDASRITKNLISQRVSRLLRRIFPRRS
jgi:glycosyltransferase involved in cell wall biosynthesis